MLLLTAYIVTYELFCYLYQFLGTMKKIMDIITLRLRVLLYLHLCSALPLLLFFKISDLHKVLLLQSN